MNSTSIPDHKIECHEELLGEDGKITKNYLKKPSATFLMWMIGILITVLGGVIGTTAVASARLSSVSTTVLNLSKTDVPELKAADIKTNDRIDAMEREIQSGIASNNGKLDDLKEILLTIKHQTR